MDESLVSMSGTGYSAMKQEFLRGFEIRLKFRGRASEEVVSVNLSP
jgi:hypothetical protein